LTAGAQRGAVIAALRHAILTGGSSGIGLATAKLLARRGLHLSILARDPARLGAALREIERERCDPGQGFAAFPVDVAERAALEDALAQASSAFGPPSLLVAAAGFARPGYFLDIPPEEFARALAVNHLGAVYAARAVLPAMREEGGGHIVLISSGAGLVGIFGYSAYSPAKFALRGFAEALRAEAKPCGIGVSIVYPPDTETPGFREEERMKPPETRRIGETARRLSADRVARAILRGVENNRFAIAPGWQMALLYRATNPFAGVIRRRLDDLARRASAKP
jgi:3-dehydrosphinganine reductase